MARFASPFYAARPSFNALREPTGNLTGHARKRGFLSLDEFLRTSHLFQRIEKTSAVESQSSPSTLALSSRQAAAQSGLVRNAGIKMASSRLTTHLARTGFQ